MRIWNCEEIIYAKAESTDEKGVRLVFFPVICYALARVDKTGKDKQGVCVGTQQLQTAAWNMWSCDFSRDSLGVLMAVIIFTNYKRSDFVKYKIPYSRIHFGKKKLLDEMERYFTEG